jgi:hypothetical protein
MKSNSETGHAKNVANFEDLISFCTGYGPNYDPSKNAFKLVALNAQFSDAQISISKVTIAKNGFDIATGNRQTAFEPLRKLSTKIINALSATDALETVVKDAKTINRKLQGSRASKTNTTSTPTITTEESAKTISTSQQSYDRLMDSFNKLINLVSAEPLYAPNEAELKTANLSTTLAQLQTLNTEVIAKYTVYSNTRIDRDNLLYAPNTGLLDTAFDVKKYVKSIFGASSPQYKQVSSLKFSRT